MAVYDLLSIAVPTLDEAQITRLSGCTEAVSRSYDDGQTLFAVGDRDVKFFVVKSGEVQIVDYSGDEPKRVTSAMTANSESDTMPSGTPAGRPKRNSPPPSAKAIPARSPRLPRGSGLAVAVRVRLAHLAIGIMCV